MNYWVKENLANFSEWIFSQGIIQNLFCIFLSFIQFIMIFWSLNEFLGILNKNRIQKRIEKRWNSFGPKTGPRRLPAWCSPRHRSGGPVGWSSRRGRCVSVVTSAMPGSGSNDDGGGGARCSGTGGYDTSTSKGESRAWRRVRRLTECAGRWREPAGVGMAQKE
jgi:hypothetical protein